MEKSLSPAQRGFDQAAIAAHMAHSAAQADLHDSEALGRALQTVRAGSIRKASERSVKHFCTRPAHPKHSSNYHKTPSNQLPAVTAVPWHKGVPLSPERNRLSLGILGQRGDDRGSEQEDD